ncbi:MAG TPA: hypothetical protein VNL14_00740 [Candidatus Acidoferrales bacterium]|nr:hypothetical protein [Candidatus Acidoferrales bacterium]
MSEKLDIERATAQAFVRLYNAKMGTSYEIVDYADAPDVCCADAHGNRLNLEITLTEDKPGDIKALLGRSDARSLETLKAHLTKVKAGEADPLERVSSLSGNVIEVVASRIGAKMNKKYGANTALVVRDTSGVDWDWDLVVTDLGNSLRGQVNPFDKGIWILSSSKERIFHVL